ncbi:SPRY domain-containing protein [Paenibacillus kribbensis]|uniref:SPRY domain-containing protein n=1 Tax=Paenibacillus kribbensis TaxID=172713 RepID=UPI0008393ED8|nr:SPRY domain-containing protein [Paenibacillus kribbensis]
MKRVITSLLLLGIFTLIGLSSSTYAATKNVVWEKSNSVSATVDEKGTKANVGKTKGKWYWEVTVNAQSNASTGIGIVGEGKIYNGVGASALENWMYYAANGNTYPGIINSGKPYTVKDVIGVALNMNDDKISWYKNGVLAYTSTFKPSNLPGEIVTPSITGGTTGSFSFDANFGATPFTYNIPEGFLPYQQPENSLTLSATGNEENIQLQWDGIQGVTTYKIERALTPGGPYEEIASDISGTSYTDNKVEENTTYYYVVSTNISSTDQVVSNEASATTLKKSTPDPSEPTEPTEPAQPTGDRAILTVTMDNGFDKEFDLSKKELNAFIAWYDAKDAGRGASFFAIDKHNNNKGPFSNRKDYVIFNKILTFEVSEYSTK